MSAQLDPAQCALALALAALPAGACSPLEDSVFSSDVVRLATSEVVYPEGAAEVSVALLLERPAERAFSTLVTANPVVAQADCYHPDYQAEPKRVQWGVGQREASFTLRIIDDDTAEIDEPFELSLTESEGATLLGESVVTVIIEDDDRTELIDAEARFGLIPDAQQDQSAVLQEALDAAGESGRGVVVIPEGRYVVLGATATPGTSVVGYGAELVRPELAGADAVTLTVVHSGSADSEMTLIEGLRFDGQRELQGPFEALEQQNAHLLFLNGDSSQPSQLRATVQSTTFVAGTGDGLAVGPDADVVACEIEAHDVFREGLSLHGGNSRLRLRGLHATATLGTTGMWLDGFIPGFEDSTHIDVTLERVDLETGDLELELVGGSSIEIRELQMGAAPFRLLAPDSTVRIIDSTLQLGLPSDRHNHIRQPGDVQVRDSVIVSSEVVDEAGGADPDEDREWAMIRVLWEGDQPQTMPGAVVFDGCQFELAADVEISDIVRIVETTGEGGSLAIENSSTACACEWFDAATCSGCSVE